MQKKNLENPAEEDRRSEQPIHLAPFPEHSVQNSQYILVHCALFTT